MDPRQSQDTADQDSSVLRAKYLDYCSAQLADLLLYLSPDEIFVLAEKVSSSDPGPESPHSYSHIVEVATSWLADRVALPTFEVWARDYTAHPERYEAYFMGLWESETTFEGGGRDRKP